MEDFHPIINCEKADAPEVEIGEEVQSCVSVQSEQGASAWVDQVLLEPCCHRVVEQHTAHIGEDQGPHSLASSETGVRVAKLAAEEPAVAKVLVAWQLAVAVAGRSAHAEDE